MTAPLGTLAPLARQQFQDGNGDPVAGGLLYTYASGTTTALATYSDAARTVSHSNPIVLDSAGRATIYLGSSAYCFTLHDADDTLIWSVDPVTPTAPYNVDLDILGTAGESLAAGNVVYMSSGAGGTTSGQWYKTDADMEASSNLATMVGMVPSPIAQGASGTVRLQGRMENLVGLTAGVTYYASETAGSLTAVAPTNVRLVGVADSATSLILFGAAVGNYIVAAGLAFVPLESSTGNQGDVVATINASAEGIRIAASLIEIDGTVTFAAGYDPTGKIATAGAAADVNAGATTISGAKITTNTLDAANILAGSITGWTITGSTITGNTIRTSAVNPRIELTSASIRGYSTAGVVQWEATTAAEGVLTAGAGKVTLDADGVTITSHGVKTFEDVSAIKFTSDDGGAFGLGGAHIADAAKELYLSADYTGQLGGPDGYGLIKLHTIGSSGATPLGETSIQMGGSASGAIALTSSIVTVDATYVNIGTDLQIRTDNSNSDPGLPWMRSDGNYLVINGSPDLYLNLDSPAGASRKLVLSHELGWYNPTQTTADYDPIVMNGADGRLYWKTNGVTQNVTIGGTTLTFQSGILTGVA